MPDPQDSRRPRDARPPQDARSEREGRRPPDSRREDGGGPGASNNRPWRTEGLPDKKPPQRPRWIKILVWVAIGWLALFAIATFQDLSTIRTTPISYTAFTEQVNAGNVKEVFARGQTIQGVLKTAAPDPAGNGTYTEFATERPIFAQDDLLAELQKSDTVVRATPVVQQRGILSNLLISLLPIALLIGFFVWFFRRQAGRMGGMLGKGRKPKRVEPGDVRVTFADVAGIDEVKSEISEIVDFLKNPDKYRRLGARVPKGVLLEGAPGTGKTLLARATAGEAGVPFFSASASEFIEMIVGVGASRVRELFEEARKVAPAIIFIDEIDTIGRARTGARSMGGNDEREQTLNQILTEMDGFSGEEGVVVLAATNRADVLDPALTRPGRFDRKVTVSTPDQKGRQQILAVHTKKVPLAPDVDLAVVARSTPGMTGADLANLVNEAALGAARRGEEQVHARDLADALEKIQLGAERGVVLPEEERLRTAYHEAGHALLGMLQPGADPVRKISIIPRGRALGVTLSTPETDRYGYDVAYLKGRIIGALGGMAAEQEIFGVVTTGAESDLQSATGIARQMIGRWGMSAKIGPVQVYPADGDPRGAGASEGLLEAVDDEVRTLIDECYAEARRLLREHRDQLEAIVRALMDRETLDEEEAYAVAGIERTPAPPLLVGAAPGSPGHGGTDAVGATAPGRTSRDARPDGPAASPSP
ncbi:ATP-dependent zinc metalloprotease FtsH [Georgenia thermotolerans]|uniref:ATP-dependent zinc metalloprotease FtsH n=1 Tax=Georgenia thermotolerans TaxID=527326 RepID=A0A7J5UT48_9MICO|nr:ATP-dependent zinc metalloprotease FtsH [Georgenia thermotolerans]KAE8765421.1 ATP-dependent zinc metalloprotease FtsH [Georgenia thermotolerans]